MTSPRFNRDREIARREQFIFDGLPPAIRKAIANCNSSVRASVVRDALLRGASEEAVIETIERSQDK